MIAADTLRAAAAPYPSQATLVDLLREQVRRTPDAIALQFESATLSYRELDDQVNRLGAYLRARGVGPEVRVAVCLERSLDMIVAVLGIQRAGGAYVPIDPGYPSERIGFMLNDSGALAVITHNTIRPRIRQRDAQIISIDDERRAIAAARPTSIVLLDPKHLAYVIYTSGSTGRPKGVQIEHRHVLNTVLGVQSLLGIKPTDRFLGVAPLAFDISELDIYLSLFFGARLIVASRDATVNPKALMALLARTAATHVQATPSLFRMLIEAGWQARNDLTILAGGEALPQNLADALTAGGAALWNLYGPTEATIYATAQHLHPGEPVTIGRALPNVTTFVLDSQLKAVPAGEPGELYIGGEGVARGYHNRPELNAERFVADPVSATRGARMYRTGDIARWGRDGALDFVGRADFQVKLRGHRIELGEVEAAVAAHAGIRAAVVVLREDEPGNQRLVAYVTTQPDAKVQSFDVRRALRERLPSYMVPEAIVILRSLPLTSNGKVDRQHLPPPQNAVDPAEDRTVPVAPRTALELRLVAIWEEVLDIRPIGTTDDFFELGVNSIVAARLFDRIEREIGARLPLSPLFGAPTIQKLAALLTNGGADRRTTSLVPIQSHGSKPPIFCVHGGAGTILHFQALARRLGDSQPFYGLQMKGLYGDGAPDFTVTGMARHYLRELRIVQPVGPYVLAGYCFGTLVAAEMTRELERRGERVRLLVMFGPSSAYLDAFGPVWKSPIPTPERFPSNGRLRAALARLRPERLRHDLRIRSRLTGVRNQLRRIFNVPIPPNRREAAFIEICRLATRRYRPRKITAPMLLFNGEAVYGRPNPSTCRWVAFGVETVEVPGEQNSERDTMKEPQVGFVAEHLTAVLDRT